MITEDALDLSPLRRELIEQLTNPQAAPDKHEYDQLKVSDPDYCGPDPYPHAIAIVEQLAARGVEVRIDDAEMDQRGYPPDVWGVTIRADVDGDVRTAVVLRDGMSPRGMLLTLAHEGGHALTIAEPDVFNVLLAAYKLYQVGGDPQQEILAETVAYLVGQATDVMPDPTISASYITGWMAAAEKLGMNPIEVWAAESIRAKGVAAQLLGVEPDVVRHASAA